MTTLTVTGTCDRCNSQATYKRISMDEVSGFRCTCKCHA